MSIALLVLVLASAAHADPRTVPTSTPTFVPGPVPTHPVEVPACPTKCVNGVTQVYERSGGDCVLKFAYPCSPYACDEKGITCRTNGCVSDAQCAPGAACNDVVGQCAIMNYRCNDSFSVLASNGYVESCMPYKCVSGACASSCVYPADCSQGFTCDKQQGRCVKQ